MQTYMRASAKSWLAALQFIAPAVPGRPVTPVLACARIDPLTGHIMATDYETTAETNLEEFEGDGRPFLVNYRELLRAIKTATKGDRSADVHLSLRESEHGGQYVKVQAAGYALTLPAPPIEDYPEHAAPKSAHAFDVEGHAFKVAISHVGTAASKDDTLPTLTGIRFSPDGDRLKMLGTDRYRLAMSKVNIWASRASRPAAFLIKAKIAADVARRVVAARNLAVYLSGDGEVVSFQLPGGVIRTQQIDGDYPDIEKLFPERPRGAFDVERAPALAAAKVALDMAERHSPVRLALTPDDLRMHFNEGLFDGSKTPLLKAEYAGDSPESFTTALNPAYLVAALGAIQGKTARIAYTTGPKPVMVTEATPTPDHKHLIMPVRMPRND